MQPEVHHLLCYQVLPTEDYENILQWKRLPHLHHSQTDCHHAHICDAMFKSACHKYVNTPENHDQLSGFRLHLGAAPDCQTYQHIAEHSFKE